MLCKANLTTLEVAERRQTRSASHQSSRPGQMPAPRGVGRLSNGRNKPTAWPRELSEKPRGPHTAPGTQQAGSFLCDTSSWQSRGCLEQSGVDGLECRQRSWGTPSWPSDARRNLNHGVLTWLPLHSTASHLP